MFLNRIIVLLCGLSIAACATVPSAPLTPAEARLRQDRQQFDNTVIGGVVQGAMIGAALGGILSAATGGDRRDIVRGAVVGGVAGGALGALDGYRTAKLKQGQMNEANALIGMAADVRADNSRLSNLVASSKATREEGVQRLAFLRADVAAKKRSAEQATADRRAHELNVAEMTAGLDRAKKTRDDYSKVAESFSPGASRSDVDTEIQRMSRQISELESNISQYSAAITASRV